MVQVPLPAVVQPSAGSVTMSAAVRVPPTVGLSLKRVNAAPFKLAPRSSTFLMVMDPQLVMSTTSGATKSFRAEVKVSEERLLRKADPKVVHPLVPRIADRRIEASPKVL